MPRITIDIDLFTYQYLVGQKEQRGSSISFEANALIQQAIREKKRKKKSNVKEDNTQHNPAN